MDHTVGNPCECGLDYVRGLAEDEKIHDKIHAEYTQGPKIAALKGRQGSGLVGKFTFHVMDGSVPFQTRQEFAQVAMVASRTIPGPAGYDGTLTKDDQRLYVLAATSHAIAMVLTAQDSYFWKLAWGAGGSVELIDKNALSGSGPKIARVWVAANYQRKGLATLLILEISKRLGIDPQKFGWELPFTKGGAAVVRKFCPAEFLGCCDITTLQEVLRTPSAEKRTT